MIVKEKVKLTARERIAEKKRLIDVETRFLDRNTEAMCFCFSHNLTVYPALQKNNRLKLFVQHHEGFLEVGPETYDQYDKQEQMEMVAKIDLTYEEFYKKHKSKGRGKYREITHKVTATNKNI